MRIVRHGVSEGAWRCAGRGDGALWPMSGVSPCPIPDGSLLAAYPPRGAYADCYATTVDSAVAMDRYVAAFYTTRLFKLERFVLRLASRPSTDADAGQLARGAVDRFAAWTVEARSDDQLLLCDYTGRTRSWLMVEPLEHGGTRLYFGSAVVARGRRDGERPALGFPFAALLGFHRLYSRALLAAARARLARS
jgi:hypothetical protein